MTASDDDARLAEHRRAQRHRTLKPAKVVFNQRSSVLDCTIRNLSASGARLQVATVVGFPERFDLVVDGVTRPAKSVWRTNKEVGVTFLADDHS